MTESGLRLYFQDEVLPSKQRYQGVCISSSEKTNKQGHYCKDEQRGLNGRNKLYHSIKKTVIFWQEAFIRETKRHQTLSVTWPRNH